MSIFQIGNVFLKKGVLLIDRLFVDTLDVEDVAEFDLGSGSRGFHLLLDNALTIRGIRILDEGFPLELDNETSVMVTISSSGVSTIVHEDVGVTEPTERFRTSSGLNVSVDRKTVTVLWSTSGGNRRWEVPDWS